MVAQVSPPTGRRGRNHRSLARKKLPPRKKISRQLRSGHKMAEFEQQEIPFKERRLRSTKLRRGFFLLTIMFSVANLIYNYIVISVSIWSTLVTFAIPAPPTSLVLPFSYHITHT